MVLEDKLGIQQHLHFFMVCSSKLPKMQAVHSHQPTHCLQNKRIDSTMILTMVSIIQTTITTGLASLLIQNQLNITPGDGSARLTLVFLLISSMRSKRTLEFFTMTSLKLPPNSYPLQTNIEMSKASLTGSGLMQLWQIYTIIQEKNRSQKLSIQSLDTQKFHSLSQISCLIVQSWLIKLILMQCKASNYGTRKKFRQQAMHQQQITNTCSAFKIQLVEIQQLIVFSISQHSRHSLLLVQTLPTSSRILSWLMA